MLIDESVILKLDVSYMLITTIWTMFTWNSPSLSHYVSKAVIGGFIFDIVFWFKRDLVGVNNGKRNNALSWYTQLQPEQEKV
jgi:hypothetical protein